MTPSDWSYIKHFGPNENWGDASRMQFELVTALDELRTHINTPILILCGTQGEHVKNSQHHEGRAVDVVFPERSSMDLFDIFLEASRIRLFGGIGLYPGWSYKGRVIGGLHLDTREGRRALWMGVDGSYGKPRYLGLNRESLEHEGVI